MTGVELEESAAKRISSPLVIDLKPCVESKILFSSPGTSSSQSEERILVLIVLGPIVAAALVHHKQRSTLPDLMHTSQHYFHYNWAATNLINGGPDS